MKTLHHFSVLSYNERLNLFRIAGYDDNKSRITVEGSILMREEGSPAILVTLDEDYELTNSPKE